MGYMASVAATAHKVRSGQEVPESELVMLREALIEMRRPDTWWGSVLEMGVGSLSAGTELYLSGGAATAVQKGAKEAASRGLKHLVSVEGREALEKSVLTRLGKGALDLTTRTAVGSGSRILEKAHSDAAFDGLDMAQGADGSLTVTLDATREPGSMWDRLPGAFTHHLVENGSERLGGKLRLPPAAREAFDKLTGPAREAVAKNAIYRVFAKKLGGERAAELLSKANERLSKLEAHAPLSEVLEEYAAAAGHTVVEGKEFQPPTMDDLTAMAASIILTRVGSMAVQDAKEWASGALQGPAGEGSGSSSAAVPLMPWEQGAPADSTGFAPGQAPPGSASTSVSKLPPIKGPFITGGGIYPGGEPGSVTDGVTATAGSGIPGASVGTGAGAGVGAASGAGGDVVTGVAAAGAGGAPAAGGVPVAPDGTDAGSASGTAMPPGGGAVPGVGGSITGEGPVTGSNAVPGANSGSGVASASSQGGSGPTEGGPPTPQNNAGSGSGAESSSGGGEQSNAAGQGSAAGQGNAAGQGSVAGSGQSTAPSEASSGAPSTTGPMWEARDDQGRVHQLPFDAAATPQEAFEKIQASLPPGSTLQKGSFNIARTPEEAAQSKTDAAISPDERVAQIADLLAGATPAQQTHLQRAAQGYDGASGLSWRTTAQNILKGTANPSVAPITSPLSQSIGVERVVAGQTPAPNPERARLKGSKAEKDAVAVGKEDFKNNPFQSGLIHIEETDSDNVILGSFKVKAGEARFIFEGERQGDTLVIAKAHIEGDGTMPEILRLAQAIGREQGAKYVIIQGEKRTTGSKHDRGLEHTPRPIKLRTGL